MDISPATLRCETDALCNALEQLEQQLDAKSVKFGEAEKLWNSLYKPKARTLAEATLHYVPSNDPDIMPEFEDGNQRVLKSNTVNCIEAPLNRVTAVAQLSTVRNQLRRLANYVPVEA